MTTVLDTNTKLENTKDTMDINQIYYTGDHRSSYTKEDIKRLASRERQKKKSPPPRKEKRSIEGEKPSLL